MPLLWVDCSFGGYKCLLCGLIVLLFFVQAEVTLNVTVLGPFTSRYGCAAGMGRLIFSFYFSVKRK